jgi:hypothetical protein
VRSVGGVRVRVRAVVPSVIGGPSALRFSLMQTGRAHLRGAVWTLGGRRLRSPVLRAAQLRADGGRQTLSVRLMPRHSRAATVRISFRTRAA